MRDQREIERDMFEARENLEQNLDQLVHKAREKAAVQAQVERFAAKPAFLLAALGAGAALGLLIPRRHS